MTNIPDEIKLYLEEIAERLWSGHAAVMVGSGFSKNAEKAQPSTRNFPDWAELGDVLFEKLSGRLPDKEHYLNPLKMAEEIEESLGRSRLDQLLRSSIPDKEYNPSKLHIRLVSLPWADVLTTNYDTLLERSTSKVTSRFYHVVVNKEDLVYSSRPRIIKLHGSYPSQRPFVISEEDYRQYPIENSPFVNTVQQILLENTLCLIGFSGDDPNFQKWIGWIRDNLGKNAPKIYLVGVLSISPAQRALLLNRNIVPVDIGLLPNTEGNHYQALSRFLEELEKKDPKTNEAQPNNYTLPKDDQGISEFIYYLKTIQDNYPGWIIAPEDFRDSIDHRIFHAIYGNLKRSKDLNYDDKKQSLELLWRINWILERMLMPIATNLIVYYEDILSTSNPFSDRMDHHGLREESSDPLKHRDNFDIYTAWWLDLNLALLRSYREDSLFVKWASLNEEILNNYSFNFSPEQQARWFYEKCLKAIFCFDYADLKKQLMDWPDNAALPFWQAKHAGLWAEFGEIKQAEILLEQALNTIRSIQQLTPVTNNYQFVSQEAHIMYLLRKVKFCQSIISDFHDNEMQKIRQEFNGRWNELKAYKCDPANDIENFELLLKNKYEKKNAVSHTNSFDIGHSTTTHYISTGPGDEEILTGYAFLRYCEEVGLPLALPSVSMNKKQARGAVERISESSPEWALVTLLRTSDKDLTDSIFDREALAKTNYVKITETAEWLINIITQNKAIIEGAKKPNDKNLFIRAAQSVPEILSRLCLKCSNDTLMKILFLLKELYESPKWLNSDGVNSLSKRLFKAMPPALRREIIPILIQLPVLEEPNPLTRHFYHEPWSYFSINDIDLSSTALELNENKISELMEKAKSEDKRAREDALYRLCGLYELSLLNDQQKQELGEALWSRTREDGLPANTPYYSWYILKLPTPDTQQALALLKKFILTFSFDELDREGAAGHAVEANKERINILNGEIVWDQNIIGATNGLNIYWTDDEVSTILNKLKGWWHQGKHHLKEENSFIDAYKEFRSRYRKLVKVFAHVVAPGLSESSNGLYDDAISLLDDIENNGINTINARAALLNSMPDKTVEILARIKRQIAIGDNQTVNDAFESINIILERKLITDQEKLNDVLSSIIQSVKWCRKEALENSIYESCWLINEHPDLLTKCMIEDLIIGLEGIIDESDPQKTNENYSVSVEDKLSYRKSAAHLAFTLFKYFQRIGEDIPEVIIKWRQICHDPEEFAEIRNQWVD